MYKTASCLIQSSKIRRDKHPTGNIDNNKFYDGDKFKCQRCPFLPP